LGLVQVARFDPDKLAVGSDAENHGTASSIGVDHAAQALDSLALKRQRLLTFEDLRFGSPNEVVDRFVSH
jgi:hypothetical protein